MFSFNNFLKKILKMLKFISKLPQFFYKELKFLISEMRNDAVSGLEYGYDKLRTLWIYDFFCLIIENLKNIYDTFIELRKKPRRLLARLVGNVVIYFFYKKKSKIGVENRIMWFLFDGLGNFFFFYLSVIVLFFLYKIKEKTHISIFNFWYHDYYILYINTEIFLLDLWYFGITRKFFILQPLIIIIFFMLFLYVRSALPRYKLVEFQNLYWKQLILYSFLILMLFIIV